MAGVIAIDLSKKSPGEPSITPVAARMPDVCNGAYRCQKLNHGRVQICILHIVDRLFEPG